MESLLARLDVKKAADDDGIPTLLLCVAAKYIAPQVHYLFNLSLKQGRLPDAWKPATIIPIYKKGDRTVVSNYRPISLLSALSKILERIVYKRVYKHVDPLIPDRQSGFRRKDGTVLQLTRLVHSLAEGLENKSVIANCYFDLSKAFDRVWHEGLLAKLAHAGIRGASLAWFEGYLKGRLQRVRVDTATSTWKLIPAGVPQGSALGHIHIGSTQSHPIIC